MCTGLVLDVMFLKHLGVPCKGRAQSVLVAGGGGNGNKV